MPGSIIYFNQGGDKMYSMTKIMLLVSIGSSTLWAGGTLDALMLWTDFTWLTWTVGVTSALFFIMIAFVLQHTVYACRLQMKNEKLQTMYHNSPDMYVSVLPDSTVLQCNKTFLKKMGYQREEIIGSSLFKTYYEGSPEYEKNTIFKEFPQTDLIRNRRMILKRKDGKKLHFNLNVYSVKDKWGKIHHYISSWRDITEKIEFKEYLNQQIGRIRSMETNLNRPQAKYKNQMLRL